MLRNLPLRLPFKQFQGDSSHSKITLADVEINIHHAGLAFFKTNYKRVYWAGCSACSKWHPSKSSLTLEQCLANWGSLQGSLLSWLQCMSQMVHMFILQSLTFHSRHFNSAWPTEEFTRESSELQYMSLWFTSSTLSSIHQQSGNEAGVWCGQFVAIGECETDISKTISTSHSLLTYMYITCTALQWGLCTTVIYSRTYVPQTHYEHSICLVSIRSAYTVKYVIVKTRNGTFRYRDVPPYSGHHVLKYAHQTLCTCLLWVRGHLMNSPFTRYWLLQYAHEHCYPLVTTP